MATTILNKIGKVITLNGKPWLINGTWSAGGRYPKKPNFKKTAKEELFDPYSTSAVWLKDSEQVGWFQFESKPKTANTLAPVILSSIQRSSVPWRGVFRLDGGRWIVAVDDTLSLHPLWDLWVSDEDYAKFDRENGSKWMTFTHGVETNSEEETVDWILNNSGFQSAYKAKPAIGYESITKKMILLFILLSIAGTGAYFGWHKWQEHEAQSLQKKEAMERENSALDREKAIRENILQEQDSIQKIESSWNKIPRPWLKFSSFDKMFDSCSKIIFNQKNVNGWRLASISCSISPSSFNQLNVEGFWFKSPYATLLDAPKGIIISPKGSVVEKKQTINLGSVSQSANENNLKTIMDNKIYWQGNSQKWGKIIKITIGKEQSFIAPVPKNLPKKLAKKIVPPVLWRYFEVHMVSSYSPAEWPLLVHNGFIPSKISITTSSFGIFYHVTGVQYASSK